MSHGAGGVLLSRRDLRWGVALLLASGTCSMALSPAMAGGTREPLAHATPGHPVVDLAQTLFRGARFEDVIALLEPALVADTLAGGDQNDALELLARSYVRVGNIEAGVRTFFGLLDVAPAWDLDTRRVADDEHAVFARARRQWQEAHPVVEPPAVTGGRPPVRSKPFYHQRRFQIAGGVVAVVATVLIRHGSAQADASLPALPGHP
jgi:hypothetical protein